MALSKVPDGVDERVVGGGDEDCVTLGSDAVVVVMLEG